MSTHYFRFTARTAAEPQRCPLLERLLARADASAVSDWRGDAFRVIAPGAASVPPVASVVWHAECGTVPGGAWVFIAAPVHYVAEMSNVRLPAEGMLSLELAEAQALAEDFNGIWSDAGIRLIAGGSAALFCMIDLPLSVTTRDPEDVLDRHIENYLPTGTDAPRLRRLMSEIEMWLFDHAVNRRRTARQALAVNGLWLWGGGPVQGTLPSVAGWAVGNDRFFRALTGDAGRSADGPGGVIVTGAEPASEAWDSVQSRWLEPALAALRAGRIARLDLSAAGRCYRLSARGGWRFWRRPQPWWQYFT